MLKIRLCCVTGILSSLLVNKIKDAASLRQIDIDIKPIAEISLVNNLDDINVVLLGPNMGYKLDKIKNVCHKSHVAVGIITMQDYGFMNGNKILTYSLSLLAQMKESILNKDKTDVEKELKVTNSKTAVKENNSKEKLKKEIVYHKYKKKNSNKEVSKANICTIKNNVSNEKDVQKNIFDGFSKNNIIFKNISLNINNYLGVDNMITKVKDLLLEAENEIYMSTNIDICEFKEEFNEISQKGVKVTLVACDEFKNEEIQVDKLYTYSNEKVKNRNPKMTLIVDNKIALVSESGSANVNEISFTTTDNPILVDTISKNIENYIYVLKLRDNINFKLRDN